MVACHCSRCANVDVLKGCGFQVDWAHRADARAFGYLRPHDLETVAFLAVEGAQPYVSLEDVARDECRFGQTSTYLRSNYRRLHADYPQVWTDLRYDNVAVLAAFVTDLPEEVVGIVCGLKEQYPVYDESDLSELEHEEIHAAWRNGVCDAIVHWLSDATADALYALGDKAEDIWYATMRGIGAYPEHDGLHVSWDLERLAGPFAHAVHSAHRRQVKRAATRTLELP